MTIAAFTKSFIFENEKVFINDTKKAFDSLEPINIREKFLLTVYLTVFDSFWSCLRIPKQLQRVLSMIFVII